MLDVVVPKRIREGWSWRVSSVHGNNQEILVAAEESFVRARARANEEEWESKLRGAGLWGGKSDAGFDETTWLESVGVREPVIVTDDYLRPWVAEALERAGSAWLAKLRGGEVWIGPKVERGDGSYEELAYWLRAHRAERAAVAGWHHPPAIAVGWNEASLRMAGDWWRKAVTDGTGKDALHCFDGRSGEISRHALGKPALGGGGKVGVVTRVLHEGYGFGRHHVLAEYCLPPLQDGWVRKRTRGFAYGCGPDAETARRKAFFEAAERFSCFFDVQEDLGRERAAEILIGAQEEGEELSSVGCAAGETLAEAAEKATAELVERFLVRQWWREKRLCPGVQQEGCQVLRLGSAYGYMAAVAIGEDEIAGGALLGAGCGRNWNAAVARAVDELAQVRYWRRYWNDNRNNSYRKLEAFLQISQDAKEATEIRGTPEIEIFDLTRRRVGVPVVRVLIRGLEMPSASEIECPL